MPTWELGELVRREEDLECVKLPADEEGPQTFSDDKKWPLSEVHEPEESKGVAVRSSAEKGKGWFIVWLSGRN